MAEAPQSNSPKGTESYQQLHKQAQMWILPQLSFQVGPNPGQYLSVASSETRKQGTGMKKNDLFEIYNWASKGLK